MCACVRACVCVKQCNANLAVYLNCLDTLLTHLFIIVVLSGSNVYSALSYIIIIIQATECTVRVYWPAMYREVRDYISSCERCTMGHAPALHTTSSRLLASRPLELLAIDLTKLETASDGREKLMFLFSPMFSRSSPRPYRRATRRQGEWPRCWFTSGSNATGSPRRSTVTRVGTLSLSW